VSFEPAIFGLFRDVETPPNYRGGANIVRGPVQIQEDTMNDPITTTIIGSYFIIVGFVVVIFRRDVKEFYDYWFGSLRSFLPLHLPDRALIFLIPVFGALSVIGGGIVLLLAISV
jgi:hypothetical protein